MSCQELTEGVRDALFLKCYQLILNCFIVIGEADKCSLDALTAVKAGKLLVTEGTGQLAGTVRTEVEEDHRITGLDGSHRSAVLRDHGRQHELIGLAVIVRCLDCLCGMLCMITLTFCQSIVSLLYAIPVFITIHCVVTAGDYCHLTNAKLFHL